MYASFSRALLPEHLPELDTLPAPFPLHSCGKYTAEKGRIRRREGRKKEEGKIYIERREAERN